MKTKSMTRKNKAFWSYCYQLLSRNWLSVVANAVLVCLPCSLAFALGNVELFADNDNKKDQSLQYALHADLLLLAFHHHRASVIELVQHRYTHREL